VHELETPRKDRRIKGAVYCELIDLEASSHEGWLAREMVVEGRGDERTRACRLGGCPARHRGHVAAFPEMSADVLFTTWITYSTVSRSSF
jgi:hypothetical protein